MLFFKRHPIFYRIFAVPTKPDRFQKIGLGLKFPFLVSLFQNIGSRNEKCRKSRKTCQNSNLTIIIPEKVTPGYEGCGAVYEPCNMMPLSIVGCFNLG